MSETSPAKGEVYSVTRQFVPPVIVSTAFSICASTSAASPPIVAVSSVAPPGLSCSVIVCPSIETAYSPQARLSSKKIMSVSLVPPRWVST
ncbi:MAG: hypothetical protein ACLPSW_15140, partial [Roseiarcus sp.]